MWQYTSRIQSERHEARDEFRIDPVGLGACAPARGEGLDLGGRQLPARDPGSVKGGPQKPFLSPSGFEANQGARFKSESSDLLVTFCLVWQPHALAFWHSVNVRPIAADVYANNPIP